MLDHVYIIPDGMGRWAKRNNTSLIKAYTRAIEKCINTTYFLLDKGARYITFSPLSIKNLHRRGVKPLLRLFKPWVKKKLNEYDICEIGDKTQTRVQFIGRYKEFFPGWLNQTLDEIETKTQRHKEHTLTLLLGYDGRGEIIQAVKKVLRSSIDPEKLDEEIFSSFLPTAELPRVDLYLTTAGLSRIHTDWMAHGAYFYVSPKMWLDFNKQDLETAIDAYEKRDFALHKIGELGVGG